MSNILLIGSGGIASLYGLMLQRSGYNITMLCRSSYQAISDHGVYVDTPWGSCVFKPNTVISSLESTSDTFQLIIVATKVLAKHDILTIFAGFSFNCPMLLIQNGIFIETVYRECFPNIELASALAFVCVFRESFTRVRHIDYGRIDLGLSPNGDAKWCSDLVTSLQAVGVDARYSNYIQYQRWEKLVWNAPFNPLSVIYNSNTKDLFDKYNLESTIKMIMKEVLMAAELDNVRLDSSIIQLKIDQTKVMNPYKTSMLLDFENKRPIESMPILGNLLSFASSKGVEMPETSKLYDQLLNC